MNVVSLENAQTVLRRFLERTVPVPDYVTETEIRVGQIFIDLANDLSKRLKSGLLTDYERQNVLNLHVQVAEEVRKFITKYKDVLNDSIRRAAIEAVAEGARVADQGYITALESVIPEARIKTGIYLQQIRVDAVRASVERRWADGIKLSDRIWNLRKNCEEKVLDVIRQGMAEGKSSVNLAKDLQSYLTANAKVAPSTKPYGTNVNYNAMRLARTEVNNAFRETIINTAIESPWVEGIQWERSNAGYDCAECDDYANNDSDGMGPGVYKPENLPLSHPNCKCNQALVTVPLSEFREKLQDWTRGGKWDDMDRWYEEVYLAA